MDRHASPSDLPCTEEIDTEFVVGDPLPRRADETRRTLGMASRVVSRVGGVELTEALRDRGFGVSDFAGRGREGHVEVVDAVLRRRDLPAVSAEVDVWDDEAFIAVEEPRVMYRGWVLLGRRK